MVYFVCKVPAPSHGISLAGTYLAKAFCCFRSYLTWGLAVMYSIRKVNHKRGYLLWVHPAVHSSNTLCFVVVGCMVRQSYYWVAEMNCYYRSKKVATS